MQILYVCAVDSILIYLRCNRKKLVKLFVRLLLIDSIWFVLYLQYENSFEK